jgi:hypothetical protein
MNRQAKWRVLVALALALSPLSGATASDHEVPDAMLHAPRDQIQKPGLGGYAWWPPSSADTGCPDGPQPHADVFGEPRGKVEVRSRARMYVRLATSHEPTRVVLRAKAPRSLRYRLTPVYFPDGPVAAWDVQFRGPRFEGEDAADVNLYAEWPDESCPEYVQWAAWNITLTRRS